MTREAVQAIFSGLNQAGVRYLVVGGLAVVAHGYVRLTVDVDLVVEMSHENLRRALDVLAGLGYRPRAPVPMEEFLQPAKRAEWLHEKGMLAFSLISSRFERTAVDIFTEAPFDFEQEWAARMQQDAAADAPAHIVRLQTLLDLKRAAARPKDLEDIRILENLEVDRQHEQRP